MQLKVSSHLKNNFAPIRYSNSNIRKMTRNFKEKPGQGGYGSRYKGKLQSRPNVAKKISRKPKVDGQDFINEVATIGRIHHVNIVQLIGYQAGDLYLGTISYVAPEDMSSQDFPHWIYDQLDKGKEIEVLDETHDDVKKLTLVALWCIQMNPLDRPSMTRVVEMLEGELQALQTPPRPSESWVSCSLEFNLISSSISSTEFVKLLESCSDSAKIDVIVA
ncbi:hypothetical protein H5410_000659 [Solanum commersonii]|uniref:Protein kinase domain-containing protein n=1 Tax=Solanum commersonii TaxID=4109 RepID=A0A9J6AWP6_SOLCO|nr:hypothetical protein H5410_000659 [Solanum commersonii]